jgi:hypothetical protein
MTGEPKEPYAKVEGEGCIYQDADGKFWFSDETENWGGGPFDTLRECKDDLASYCKWLEGGDQS